MEDLSNDILDINPNAFSRRRQLLPLWIKFFIWFFFLTAAIAILALFIGTAIADKVSVSIYGFSSPSAFSPEGLMIMALFLLKGLVSFGLWFEKDWGPKLAIFDGIIGCILCVIEMFIQAKFSFRLEILIMVPYIIKMINIRKPWVLTLGK